MSNLADHAESHKRRALAGSEPADRLRLAALPACILMLERARIDNPAAVLATLPRGSAVILRDYAMSDRPAQAAQLATLCRRLSLRLLVAGDPRLAFAVGAGGVHLPEGQLAHGSGIWRRWRRPAWLITAAAHSPAAIARARRAGVDAVLLSPVFPTASHPGGATIGPVRFAAWTRTAALPVYALGGVTTMTGRRLKASGAIGIAGIGGFVSR